MSENEYMFSYFDLDNEYQLTEGKFELSTPNTTKVNVIKINQTPELEQTVSLYSGGFIIYKEQRANNIVFRTNRPIYQIGDGKFSIEDPEK
ncbi:hypothetical protein [Leuconostoc citreum]|uniref:hypothetical protein n=1 Tax=Leuconostoc citreum TaxID=33964 RepID=UPI0021A2B635|nr:hypothetical protein [Leuconostoc citreum]MCT3059071.1 hypothetical protein [Leuconostoc citreum]MCT3076641.1 hypothetical protein [Leuconostoc citreum]